jgi:hypothetical protein
MHDGPEIVDAADFRLALDARASALLEVARRVVAAPDADSDLDLLTRPLVALVLSEASQLEELLDAYGALRNRYWRGFRRVVAAMKLFARVHYSLLHLAHTAPSYRLLPVEGDLGAALLQARRFTARVLRTASRRLLDTGTALGLAPRPVEVCQERLPPGTLPQDCARRHVADVAGTVAKLATAFLNLADQASDLASPDWAGTSGRPPPALLQEPEVRRQAEDFHNLQALYDTHVAYTDVEQSDPELPSLRGHASVVFHLLETATDLTHYHERHVLHAAAPGDAVPLFADLPDCIEPQLLEAALRECSLAFAARYVLAGRALAQQLLRRYAEEGEISVPVPRYRGFHVRPSTLVARMAYHYGSPVTMRIEDESYDAASPLDLFRANELINAKKRRWLAQEIARLVDVAGEELGSDAVRAVRGVLVRLAEEAKIIVYERPLPRVEGQLHDGQTVLSFVVDAVARLQALGKLDIVTPVTATFRGDRRVLADLQLLASSGYGEDAYGNNIALPTELKYLRR